MDNENKIVNIGDSKELFLYEGSKIRVAKEETYSLEHEYGRTKKNRNTGMIMIILAFILFMGAGAFFASALIQKGSAQTDVVVAENENIKLAEALSSVLNNETKLRLAKQDLEDIKKNREDEIVRTQDRTKKEFQILENKDLAPKDRETEYKKLKDRESRSIAAIESRYKDKIAKKEAEINDLEEEISRLEGEQKAGQKGGSRVVVDNYQKLSDIRTQRVREEYEAKMAELERKQKRKIAELEDHYRRLTEVLILKYNPVYTEDDLKRLLQIKPEFKDREQPKLKDYNQELKDYKIPTKVSYDSLKGKVNDYFMLVNRMMDIPYTNSVAPTVIQINSLSRSIVRDYELLWYNLGGVVKRQDSLLKNYHYALESYSKTTRANGYVLDTRDPDNVIVYVEDIYEPKAGDEALVYRDDEYIGKIKVYPADDRMRARAEEVAEGKAIQPLDKILFLLK